MHYPALHFKLKSTIAVADEKIVELLFKSWIDTSCDNNVNYEISQDIKTKLFTFRADFEHIEDAIIVKLHGIPDGLNKYIELVS